MEYHMFPYATYRKAGVGHHVVSLAIVIAFGLACDGRREVLGFHMTWLTWLVREFWAVDIRW
jgi:transposase-like protein